MTKEGMQRVSTASLLLMLVAVLSGCADSLSSPMTESFSNQEVKGKSLLGERIGYLGFKDNQVWATQFNDCTVFDLKGARY